MKIFKPLSRVIEKQAGVGISKTNILSVLFSDIQELKIIKGLALNDILTEVHTFVHRSKYFCVVLTIVYHWVVVEFPTEILVKLVDKMAEIEHRLSTGANENIQLTALISVFQHAKELYPPETV